MPQIAGLTHTGKGGEKMLEETLKTVKEAEETAGKKLQEAEEQAARILEEAKAAAKEMKAQTLAECKSLVTDQEAKVNADGEIRKNEAKKQMETEIESMRQSALNREQEAIQAVLDHLV